MFLDLRVSFLDGFRWKPKGNTVCAPGLLRLRCDCNIFLMWRGIDHTMFYEALPRRSWVSLFVRAFPRRRASRKVLR